MSQDGLLAAYAKSAGVPAWLSYLPKRLAGVPQSGRFFGSPGQTLGGRVWQGTGNAFRAAVSPTYPLLHRTPEYASALASGTLGKPRVLDATRQFIGNGARVAAQAALPAGGLLAAVRLAQMPGRLADVASRAVPDLADRDRVAGAVRANVPGAAADVVAGWFGGGAKDPVSQAHRDVVPGLIRQTLAADFAAGRRNPSVYSRALNFMRSLTPAGAVVTQLMDRVPPVPYPDVRAEVWRALSDGKVRRGMRSTDVVGSPWLRAWADAFGPAVGPSRSSR